MNGSSTDAELHSRVRRAADRTRRLCCRCAARRCRRERSRAIGAVVPPSRIRFRHRRRPERRLKSGDHPLLASSEYDPRGTAAVRYCVSPGQSTHHAGVAGDHHKTRSRRCFNQWPVARGPERGLVSDRPHVSLSTTTPARQLTRAPLDLGHTEIGVFAGRTRNNDRASRPRRPHSRFARAPRPTLRT